MQARRTKEIQQVKYDSFFVDKYHIYHREYGPLAGKLIALEFRKLPISFKTRRRDELNTQIS